jgi:hypothetical protein
LGLASDWVSQQFDELGLALVQKARICGVTLDEPNTVERIIRNDATVCTRDNPAAFTDLRGLLMLALKLQGRSFELLGPQETMEIADQVRARIRAYLGAPSAGNA